MCLLIESLKLVDGRIQHVDFHNERFNRSRKVLFQQDLPLDINQLISNYPISGVYKMRIWYDERGVQKIDYEPFKSRPVSSLKVMETSLIYPFKYADRDALDKVYDKRGDCDDVLLVNQGNLGDTSRANIIIFDGQRWVTPKTSMLPGTTRARLIARGIVHEADLSVDDLSGRIELVAAINAVTGICPIQRIRRDNQTFSYPMFDPNLFVFNQT